MVVVHVSLSITLQMGLSVPNTCYRTTNPLRARTVAAHGLSLDLRKQTGVARVLWVSGGGADGAGRGAARLYPLAGIQSLAVRVVDHIVQRQIAHRRHLSAPPHTIQRHTCPPRRTAASRSPGLLAFRRDALARCAPPQRASGIPRRAARCVPPRHGSGAAFAAACSR
jgi:hypothetical protein